MDRQGFEAFHLGKSRGYAMAMIYARTTGRVSTQLCFQHDRNHLLK
jgi:hypothetical protein